MTTRGIDLRQPTDRIIFRAALIGPDGLPVTTGTTELRLFRVEDDETLDIYDWTTNDFVAPGSGTPDDETTMTNAVRRDSTGSDIATGVWLKTLSTLTNFTANQIYIAETYNALASPPFQQREFQFGGVEGSQAATGDEMDLVDAPNATAIAAIQNGLATPTNITAGTLTTVTDLTNLPSIPANWITATGITDGAFTAAKFAAGAFDAVWTVTSRTLSSISGLGIATAAKMLAYVRLLARKDAAIATDHATELAEINLNVGSGAGAYDNTLQSLEAVDTELGTIGSKTTNLPANPASQTKLDTVETLASGVSGFAALKTDTAAVKVVTDKLATAIEADGLVYRFTENALEEAPSGGGGGTSGSGAISQVFTIRDDASVPIDGCEVWISTDLAGTNVVAGTSSTDAFGNVTFLLDAGTYYLWRQLAGMNFTNPTLVTVSA